MKIRVSILILANALGVIILLYFMDILQISKAYELLKNKTFPPKENLLHEPTSRQNDMALLHQQEQQKMIEAIRLKALQLTQQEQTLAQKQETFHKEQETLLEQQERFQNQQKYLLQQKQKQNTYEKKVFKLATVYYNMPPQNAAERLIFMEDDLLILDVLKAMDGIAEQNEQASVVPYLYSLMPKDVAARLLQKASIHDSERLPE